MKIKVKYYNPLFQIWDINNYLRGPLDIGKGSIWDEIDLIESGWCYKVEEL